MSYLAEQNLIGSLLMDSDSISQVNEILTADMFSNPLLGRIYFEYQRAYDSNEAVTLPKLVQNINDYPQQIILDEIKECTVKTPTSVQIKEHAKVIMLEHKAQIFLQMLNRIQVDPANIDKQISQLAADLELLNETGAVSDLEGISDITGECMGAYFIDNDNKKIYLGFDKLDDILGGLEGGDMIVIAARPAVGKSAFVTQIALHIAMKNKKVAFFNLEMEKKQVYERFVVELSKIELTRLKRATRFVNDEYDRFKYANDTLLALDTLDVSTGQKSVSEIRSRVRHRGYDIIIIDYLQLLKADSSYRGNRYAEVGAISKAIKALAMELNIPIIALSQLNRASEQKETREPSMAEIRESGDIEQDASVILLMWNTDIDDRRKKCVKVEKQRQGKTGKVNMRFNGEYMKFEEVENGDWDNDLLDDNPFA